MDRDVVTAKLESLRRCVERVRTRTPVSVEELVANHDAQDIICLNLERAVQACVDIAAHIVSDTECTVPDSMAGTFDALERQGVLPRHLAERMRRAVGFRDTSPSTPIRRLTGRSSARSRRNGWETSSNSHWPSRLS